ncbi:hypothetical protein KI387_036886, partial [Taxus chinensis]
EPALEACFEKEETEQINFEHACTRKEKVKMVYVIDGEDAKNLDVNHSVGMLK